MDILELALAALNAAPRSVLKRPTKFEGLEVRDTYDVAAIIAKARKKQEMDTISMLSAALAFYADAENWKEKETVIGMMPSICTLDGGKLAETTLNSLPVSNIFHRMETP